jgi:hypothetical protein
MSDRLISDMIVSSAFSEAVKDGDWPEDRGHENGNYSNLCVDCGNFFIGHKRRVVCRICAERRVP